MKQLSSYVKRTPLIDKLPLDTPLGVQVCPSTFCNFRCFYCKHTLDENKSNSKVGSLSRELMSMETFEKVINQLMEFPRRIELLQFAWLGEPLMNPHISDMVAYAKKAGVANTVSIVTNGSLLTHEMSDKLIMAGLDRLRISLQGFTEKDYLETSKYNMEMSSFIDNIRYFYQHKKSTQVYIKMMDVMLPTKEDEEKFHRMYDDLCDVINIEHLVPLHNEIDISEKKKEFDVTYFGANAIENKICSYPFLNLMIAPNGSVYLCDNADEDESGKGMDYGSIYEKTLYMIWNGKEREELLKEIIKGNKEKYNSLCKNCPYPKYHMAKEDRLDPFVDKMIAIYNVK